MIHMLLFRGHPLARPRRVSTGLSSCAPFPSTAPAELFRRRSVRRPYPNYKGVAAKPNYVLFRWPPPIPPTSRIRVAKLFRGYSAVEFQGSLSFHSPLTCNPSSPLFPLALDPPPARPPKSCSGVAKLFRGYSTVKFRGSSPLPLRKLIANTTKSCFRT